MLYQRVDDVDAEAVDTAVEPEPQGVLHGLHDLGVAPVEIGLLGQEQVQIPLARGVVPRPRRFAGAEGRLPVVGRPVGRAVDPHVPVALGVVARGAGLDEPRVLVGGVVRHPVDDHPQPPGVGLLDEAVEVGQGAEDGVDTDG